MLRVRVALVTGGYPELMPPHNAQGPDIPYGQRASVALHVSEDESMLSMFGRALDELGVAFAEPGDVVGESVDQVSLLAFYKPDDDAGSPVQERFIYPQHLLTVPADGRIRWGSSLHEARVTDVARAGAHGLIDGDALRPYVVILPAAGASEFLYAWAAALTALNIAANIDGTLNLVDRIRRRLRRGKRVIDDHYLEWGERGASPEAFTATLRRAPWTTYDLGPLLGVEPEEVVALMELYGFALDNEGRWTPSEDEEARLLRLLEEDAIDAFTSSRRSGLVPEVDFRNRVERRFSPGEHLPQNASDDAARGSSPRVTAVVSTVETRRRLLSGWPPARCVGSGRSLGSSRFA